jgi:hypothetical protein
VAYSVLREVLLDCGNTTREVDLEEKVRPRQLHY